MSVGTIRSELYAAAVELVMSYEPISDREADEIHDAFVNAPKPSTNPFYIDELARPDSEINRTGLRKTAPERKTRDELIAEGIAAGRAIDMRRKV